jgi:hypothetical protein
LFFLIFWNPLVASSTNASSGPRVPLTDRAIRRRLCLHNPVANSTVLAKTDVLKEMKHYGLHRHFTGASSVLMFGGGMKHGFLHGESAPERPCVAIKDPVSISDLHATIFRAMGISPKTAFDVERRPFYVTKDGKGQPVGELFS